VKTTLSNQELVEPFGESSSVSITLLSPSTLTDLGGAYFYIEPPETYPERDVPPWNRGAVGITPDDEILYRSSSLDKINENEHLRNQRFERLSGAG